ncbi:MAG: serine hydrolase, partial [Steroidobacteraceae bacterium]|nr:serine hydrolase [Steroidobacteraceae bacterium]
LLAGGAALAAVDRFPGAAAAYAVVLDGELLWARGLDTPRAPASLSKLLGALVLLEGDWQPQRTVTVAAAAARARGSRLGLRAGERLRAADLLTAMLVRSANDACLALALDAAGSAAAFVAKMNRRAHALGMRHSHFADPCGLDAPSQRTTVRDLLRLAAAALREPQIAARVALTEAVVQSESGRRFTFANNNLLVGRELGVIGLKSGFTSHAGKCLIAVAVRGAHRVWVVMLGGDNRWWVAAGLLDAAFAEAGGGLPP